MVLSINELFGFPMVHWVKMKGKERKEKKKKRRKEGFKKFKPPISLTKSH